LGRTIGFLEHDTAFWIVVEMCFGLTGLLALMQELQTLGAVGFELISDEYEKHGIIMPVSIKAIAP